MVTNHEGGTWGGAPYDAEAFDNYFTQGGILTGIKPGAFCVLSGFKLVFALPTMT